MVKWSIELNEYRVKFRPRQSIKAQTLANFMVKCFFYDHSPNQEGQSARGSSSCWKTPENELDQWLVYIDGSSTLKGVGVGILLV